MPPERGVYDFNKGLKISYPRPATSPQASAEVPIVFREDLRVDQVPDRQQNSSTPDWQRDLSTHTASVIARSNQRLLAYFSEVNAFEDTARAQERLNRFPSIQREDQSELYRTYNHAIRPTAVPIPAPLNPQTYRGVRTNFSTTPSSKRVQGSYSKPVDTSSRPSTRRKRNSDRSTDPIPTQSLSSPSQQVDRERKDSQFLPRKTYVPPQVSSERPSNPSEQSANHVPEPAVPPIAVTSEKSERPIYAFPRVATVGSGRSAGPGVRPELYNGPLKPDRSPFGDEYEIRVSKPYAEGNSDDRPKLDEDILSPKSFNTQSQQRELGKQEIAELPTDPPHSTEMTKHRSNLMEQKGLEKSFRSMTTSTFEPTPAEEKRFKSDDQSTPSFAFWRKPWVLIATAIALVVVLSGLAVGLFFVIKGRNNSNTSNTNVPGGFSKQPTALINNAFATVGTSMAAINFSGSSGTANSGYMNFFQHSNGELRMTVFNNSQWQSSQFVTADAHEGTPISAYSRGNNSQISLFYFDKNKVLQELRSNQDGSTWTNGTIGTLVQTSNAPSDLTAQYVGVCQGAGLAWLVFHTGSKNEARLLYWNANTDTWTASGAFPDVKQGSGFTGNNDASMWRFYYTNSVNSQITEELCPDCCNNPSTTGWVGGLNGSKVSSSTGGMVAVSAGTSRLIYYQDANGIIHELNSTGQYPNEAWVTDVSSTAAAGNSGVAVAPGSSGPAGMPVARAMPNSKMSVVSGFQNNTQQVVLFYQTKGTDITMQLRSTNLAGQWSASSTIPVSR